MNMQIKKLTRILIFTLSVCLLISARGQSLELVHVAENGDDSNSGEGWTVAKATIAAGLSAAAPNGTVLVSNGLFTVTSQLYVTDGKTVSSLYGTNNPPLETVVSGGGETRVFNVNNGTLDGLVIINGKAFYAAGALMNNGTIRHCRVEGNVATSGGAGGIELDGASLVTNCAIIRNQTLYKEGGGNQYGGSAMKISHKDVEVADCLIAENFGNLTHTAYGTIQCNNKTGHFKRCVITRNTNAVNGRVISTTTGGGGLVLYDTIVVSNTLLSPSSSVASAVYLGANSIASNLTVEANTGMRGVDMLKGTLLIDSRVRLHEEVLHGGAGIYANGGGTIDSCLIESNSIAETANGNALGAGIWFNNSTGGTVVNSTIRDNIHNQGTLGGGGIGISSSVSTLISNCWISGNSITPMQEKGDGGGVSIYRTAATTNVLITHSVIAWNEAGYKGGGIHAPGLATNVVIRNCLVYGNRSERGGGVYLEGDSQGSTLVESCTIADNIGVKSGATAGLFSSWRGNMDVVNSILYGNLTEGENSNWGRIGGSSGVVFLNCCTVPTAGIPGSDNFEADPLFLAPEENCYQLKGDSPCINIGIMQDWMTDAIDLDGRARIDCFSRKVDIGAYEYIPVGTMFNLR